MGISFHERWIDRFLGSDPGLNRLRTASQSVLTIGLILIAERIFVSITHALQIQTHGAKLPVAAAAQVAMANHEFMVIAMLLGAMIGMISTFAVMDRTARGQLTTMLFLPLVMVPALAFGLAIGGHRIIALISFPVILGAGTYLRRFGPRGFVAGMLLFMGDFFGFFMHGAIALGDIGWLIAELGVGLLVAIIVRFAFFYPRPAKALARIQRSYGARARKVASLALELFDDPAHSVRDRRRLHRQLVRLNEAALMIDAQLGDPNAVADGSSGQLLHQRLFDVELALTNIARFAAAMTRLNLPDNQRQEVRLALLGVVNRDTPAAKVHATKLISLLDTAEISQTEDPTVIIVPHRFAGSVITLADSMTEWMALGMTDGEKGEFEPSVMLFGGWLPGSNQVSAAASKESGANRGEHIRLAPYTRTAIQIAVAVSIAVVLGDLVSGRRFYWAVIAAFITFMGVNSSAEQVRKALFRVGGTVVGIAIGSLLVTAVGHHTNVSIAIIMVALFFGFYLQRINYAFMVIGITVMISQLYVQLGEFSNSLLLLRLEETALGAAVAVIVVMLVFPLRTRRVLRIALRNHVRAVGQLVNHASGKLLDKGHQSETTLRADARAIDVSYQALFATAGPLRRGLFGSVDEDTAQLVRLASASRNYSRNLVNDVEAGSLLDPKLRQHIKRASSTLTQSLDVVANDLTAPGKEIYVRSSALFDKAERYLEEHSAKIEDKQLAIRDLMLIDGTMAQLAEAIGLQITDHDTTTVA